MGRVHPVGHGRGFRNTFARAAPLQFNAFGAVVAEQEREPAVFGDAYAEIIVPAAAPLVCFERESYAVTVGKPAGNDARAAQEEIVILWSASFI